MTWVPSTDGSWDGSDPEDTGGAGGYGFQKMWTFFLKEDTTHRLLFLTGTPMPLWEHELWPFTGSNGREVCLKKNKIENECPLCDRSDEKKEEGKAGGWSEFIGYFVVIDLGRVAEDGEGNLCLFGKPSADGKRMYQFQRRLFGARRGTKTKPGNLPTLARKAKRSGKDGNIKGCVFDVTRTGKKAAGNGNDFEFIEHVDADNWAEYMMALGADIKTVDFSEMTDDMWRQEFTPSTIEVLTNIANASRKRSGGRANSPGGGGGRVEGAGYGGTILKKASKPAASPVVAAAEAIVAGTNDPEFFSDDIPF